MSKDNKDNKDNNASQQSNDGYKTPPQEPRQVVMPDIHQERREAFQAKQLEAQKQGKKRKIKPTGPYVPEPSYGRKNPDNDKDKGGGASSLMVTPNAKRLNSQGVGGR